jgi:RNA polymerase sigma-70 factor (ECF subfamily)
VRQSVVPSQQEPAVRGLSVAVPTADEAQGSFGAGHSSEQEPLTRLVARARGGDLSAFREIVETLGQATLVHARKFFPRDEQLAQDTVQETWLRALRGLRGLDDDRKFGAWLWQILRHELDRASRRRRVLRRREVSDVDVSEATASAAPRPDDPLAEREALDARDRITSLFWAAVRRLPHQQQVVVELIAAGKSNSEIATILDLPKGTIHTYRHRAQTVLARDLTPHAALWKTAARAIGQDEASDKKMTNDSWSSNGRRFRPPKGDEGPAIPEASNSAPRERLDDVMRSSLDEAWRGVLGRLTYHAAVQLGLTD